MLKISVLLTRRPDLTWEEFDTYWRETHTPLLKSVPEMAHVVRRYVQLHKIDIAGSGLPAAGYDGVAEVWVDDLESAWRLFSSPSYLTIVGQDEENFLDRSKTLILVSQESVVVG